MKYYRSHILVSINETSIAAGVHAFLASLRSELAKADLTNEINILETGPLGFFGRGICLSVYPENVNYESVKVEDITELVQEHFLKGRPVKRIMLDSMGKFSPNFNYANRIVLRNSVAETHASKSWWGWEHPASQWVPVKS